MQLPSGRQVTRHTPIYPGSNFTWGEATKDCTRHITDLVYRNHVAAHAIDIEMNIVATAKYLDEIRKILGNRPLIITSWYRPPHINKQVGGGGTSRHLYGDAVDFFSHYLHPHDVYSKLDIPHGNVGGLGKYYSFTHIDRRGAKVRW